LILDFFQHAEAKARPVLEALERLLEEGVIVEESLLEVLDRCQIKALYEAGRSIYRLEVVPLLNVMVN
jgi:hypothetical protein